MRALVLVILTLATAAPSAAQISPGELARGHEFLEGMKNCLKCHELGAGPSAEKCLACHGEIAERIEAGAGYHHRAVTVGGEPCFACHSDHAGRAFELVHWSDGREHFDHDLTGWTLAGAHRERACRDCHQESRVSARFARSHPDVNTKRTFLGLDAACAACHSDPHAGQFTRDCIACHGESTWKPADRFDHALTAFPLRGRHTSLDCARCHTAGEGVDVVRYAGVSTDCASCHTDPHAGRLGAGCATCHGEDAWKPVTAFDHGRTAFPLTGRHRSVACAGCHGGADGENPPRYTGIAHDNCASCHTDPHQNRLGPDCASCHATGGWNEVRVAGGGSSGFDHARTRFPLDGRHAGVECAKCHTEGSKTAGLAFDTCARCHADVHLGQFAATPRGGACERCHDVNGFVPARFTAADHDGTRFTLAGAHLAEPCVACHRKETFPSGETARRFTFADLSCSACHDDAHAGQFTDTAPVKRCEQCHRVESWHSLAFDHNRDTPYRLEGAHRRASCAGCHTPAVIGGHTVTRYRATATDCAACHIDQPTQLGVSP